MNYSEEEKEAVEKIKEELKRVHKINHLTGTYILIDMLEILLNLIQKQEALIDKMAEQLTTPVHSKKWVKEYYEKEVEKV